MKVNLAFVSLFVLLLIPACVTSDYRKPFSVARTTVSRADSHEMIREKLLKLTPMGASRDVVHAVLKKNLRDSAVQQAGDKSTIYARLWTRYVVIFAEFETTAYYEFDDHGKLINLRVSEADSSW